MADMDPFEFDDFLTFADAEGRKCAKAMKRNWKAGEDYGLTPEELHNMECEFQQTTLRHGLMLREFSLQKGCSERQASAVLRKFSAAIWQAYGQWPGGQQQTPN